MPYYTMKLQLILIACSVVIFGFTLTNCTTEEKKPAPTVNKVAVESTAKTQTVATVAHSQEPAWKDMDHDQRVKYMRETVLPKMRQTFAEFDEKKFGRINCKTCHGDGATNESFEMPNPKLPKLPTNTEGFQKLMKDDPAAMEFMMKKVKPQMAELLGLPEMDPNTNPKGFGCFNCHTAKQ